MITVDSPLVDAARAARRAARGRLPFWLASPGDGDVEVVREFVGCDPVRVVTGSSTDELERAWRAEAAGWQGPAGVPIAVGFLSYDLGRRFEPRVAGARAASGWPDLEFRFFDAVWTRDVRGGRAAIWAKDRAAGERLSERLHRTSDEAPGPNGAVEIPPFAATEAPNRHLAGVARVLEYLRAGDVYQVNLARRLAVPFVTPAGEPDGLSLFARLQREAPAPHALWFPGTLPGACLIGNSPERFLRVTPDGRIETRPIKGTRARAAGASPNQSAGLDLANDPKERAEHTMIVDLERNDLGRVAVTGSVEVVDFARVVSLPTVHHLVTTVRAHLRPQTSLTDILRATFPGGSVTGAPKIRAMQIIDDLEVAARGPYCGATGWLGAAGDFDLAVAIRTALLRDGLITLWVGGGIVADSLPARELDETEEKAAAFRRLCSRE